MMTPLSSAFLSVESSVDGDDDGDGASASVVVDDRVVSLTTFLCAT